MKRRKSSLITKLIVLAIAVYATTTLMSMQTQIQSAETRKADLESQIEAAKLENQKLEDAIDQYSLEDRTEQIAREKLGLVTYGEIVFYDVSN